MSKKDEALKLALSVLNEVRSETFRLLRNGQKLYAEEKVWNAIYVIREALMSVPDGADSALDRMAENARELGLDYEPPCKTGSQCTSKCQQCEQPSPVPKAHAKLKENRNERTDV